MSLDFPRQLWEFLKFANALVLWSPAGGWVRGNFISSHRSTDGLCQSDIWPVGHADVPAPRWRTHTHWRTHTRWCTHTRWRAHTLCTWHQWKCHQWDSTAVGNFEQWMLWVNSVAKLQSCRVWQRPRTMNEGTHALQVWQSQDHVFLNLHLQRTFTHVRVNGGIVLLWSVGPGSVLVRVEKKSSACVGLPPPTVSSVFPSPSLPISPPPEPPLAHFEMSVVCLLSCDIHALSLC